MKEMIEKLVELEGKEINIVNRTKREEVKKEYDKLFNEFKKTYFKKLEGTEKQVNWANSIKEKNFKLKLLDIVEVNLILKQIIKECEENGKEIKDSRRYEDFNDEKEQKIDKLIKYINNISAKEIIETR